MMLSLFSLLSSVDYRPLMLKLMMLHTPVAGLYLGSKSF